MRKTEMINICSLKKTTTTAKRLALPPCQVKFIPLIFLWRRKCECLIFLVINIPHLSRGAFPTIQYTINNTCDFLYQLVFTKKSPFYSQRFFCSICSTFSIVASKKSVGVHPHNLKTFKHLRKKVCCNLVGAAKCLLGFRGFFHCPFLQKTATVITQMVFLWF